MNVLGFIAVILVCGTALGIAYLNYKTHAPHTVQPPNPTPEQLKELETQPVQVVKNEKEEQVEHPIAVASMDAVIQSVNELMGVEAVKEEKPHGAREE